MSAGQTSQWKWAVKLTNKCSRDFPALKSQVQPRDLSAGGGEKEFVVRWTRSDVSGSPQGAKPVTLKGGTSCSPEQHSQRHLSESVSNEGQKLLSTSYYVNVCCASFCTGENWSIVIIPLSNHCPTFSLLMAMMSSTGSKILILNCNYAELLIAGAILFGEWVFFFYSVL